MSRMSSRPYRRAGPITNADYLVERVGYRSACWTWSGRVSGQGYGKVNARPGIAREAHRVMYEQTHRVCVVPWIVLHHRCHNRRCVRPDHLEPMTVSEHTRTHRPPKPAPHIPNVPLYALVELHHAKRRMRAMRERLEPRPLASTEYV